MIGESRKFSSVSTHSDVTPTVLSFLHTNYGIDIADKASWISSGIDTAQGFGNIHSMPLMRNKNELIDYVDGLYYLAGEQIYKLKPDLKIEQIENDSIRTILKRKLERFKQINRYVCEYNNLYPDTLPKAQNHISNSKDDSIFASLKIDNLDSDQLYEHARKAALNSRFEESRVICRKLLRKNPRNVDVHMLLGRTYAWDKNYETARSIYFDVLHSMPNNTDALSALVDLELWSGNNERALFLSDSSLAYYQDSEALLIRKALALKNLGHTSEGIDFLHKALKLNPNNEEALALKKQLGE
jgi:tetratricopeptide (TPR) repeat protein